MIDRNLFRLGHIMECIEKLEYLFRELPTFNDFETKWIEHDAVIRNVEIIGEAVAHISEDLKQNYPDVSWKK